MSSYFYPRPPRGGRREVRPLDHIALSISIHALREEGDMVQHRAVRFRKNFYPRPPRGGRPESEGTMQAEELFLSTPSARRATLADKGCTVTSEFLSTPSARRATSWSSWIPEALSISIHALREEGDEAERRKAHLSKNFYPRPPRGGRPQGSGLCSQAGQISIHALREEVDPELYAVHHCIDGFLSTPSARRATPGLPPSGQRLLQISIHALREEGD